MTNNWQARRSRIRITNHEMHLVSALRSSSSIASIQATQTDRDRNGAHQVTICTGNTHRQIEPNLTMSSPKPHWFAPSSIPPILLLTVVTSFAFNHAMITTQRKADVRTHRVHTALLDDTIDFNSRVLFYLNPPCGPSTNSFLSRFHPRPSSTKPSVTQEPEWIQEQHAALARRWKSLGLNPHEYLASTTTPRQSISYSVIPEVVGPKQVSWSEIFLGDPQTRSSLTQRWHKVTAGIKESFATLNPASTTTSTHAQAQLSDQEHDELQQLSQLWSDLQKSS